MALVVFPLHSLSEPNRCLQPIAIRFHDNGPTPVNNAAVWSNLLPHGKAVPPNINLRLRWPQRTCWVMRNELFGLLQWRARDPSATDKSISSVILWLVLYLALETWLHSATIRLLWL